MRYRPMAILLVEDNPADAFALRKMLAEADKHFDVTGAESLTEARQRLGERAWDAIVLDLSLPDSLGIETVEETIALAPDLPIVVLTGLDDEAVGIEAVRRGAQDFLVKGRIDGVLLARAIRYAVERNRAECALKLLNDTLEMRVAERTAEAERRADQLRWLASELSQAEQQERRRLARLLHDHLQQLLVGARLRLEVVGRQVADEDLSRQMNGVTDLLNESIEASRSLATELSPPILQEAGLARALEWLARWMQDKHGLVVEVSADNRANPLSEALADLLFQAVRELLFNVVKHAAVTRASVRMALLDEDRVEIDVSDEGAGFDVAEVHARQGLGRGGLGLFSIHERLDMLGGSMDIRSAPGAGSRFVLRVPRSGALGERDAQTPPAEPARPDG